MNLHILNDEKFFDPFVEKLENLGLLANNLFVVKECGPLKFIRRKDLIYGRMCDKKLIGDVSRYEKVFIHCFTLEMYGWVHQHTFNELNWMVWGKELYGPEFLFEHQTKSLVRKARSAKLALDLRFFKIKNFFMNINAANIYSKVDNVLTWIEPEYKYAIKHVKGLKAKHQDFAYTFEYDAESISSKFYKKTDYRDKTQNELRCILGNSGVASNNHLDAIRKIQKADFHTVTVPISYGNKKYIQLLKKEIIRKYSDKNITYLDRFMSFDEYMFFFSQYDAFISNSIRPVGMGNIWMALLMGKIVFMNTKNLVYPYLQSLGVQIFDIDDMEDIEVLLGTIDLDANCRIAVNFLSKSRINELYLNLFSNGILVS